MRVFMLGWEFPPFISGGLGTACYGLTRAMSRRSGASITFVLPKPIGSRYPEGGDPRGGGPVRLLAPQSPSAAFGSRGPEAVADTYQLDTPGPFAAAMGEGPSPSGPGADGAAPRSEDFANVTFRAVPALFASPYPAATAPVGGSASRGTRPGGFLTTTGYHDPAASAPQQPDPGESDTRADYAGDLVAEARRYAALCVDLAAGVSFDVVHAHDWLTFPAGVAVAAVSGKPLVVHVHSTEFDRAGDQANHDIVEVERRGVHAAQRVIAVSRRTKRLLQDRYGVRPERIEVVYNGIEPPEKAPPESSPESPPQADPGSPPQPPSPDPQQGASGAPAPAASCVPQCLSSIIAGDDDIDPGDKVVLFLGRLTMQKGPEYFVAAAQKVLEKAKRVTFVMAGSGEMARPMAELAHARGLGDKVVFTGFLDRRRIRAMFERADVLVMPSVSEPFGITPLEAIRHNVPVIISRTSGVAEVLEHALKVDFWDVEEIANKVLAVLRHPPLGDTLRHHADAEARRLTWDRAADSCLAVYRAAAAAMN